MKTITAFVQLSLVAIAASVAAREWAPGQQVKTSSGTVKGRPATRPGFSQVSEYIGIPYAEAPQGALRWLAPKPYRSNDNINATTWKDDCSQPTGGGAAMMASPELRAYGEGMGGPGHKISEDCLGLNIWTKPQSGDKSKAVMVWIHGGGFSNGSPHAPFMDGSRYSEEQDVVLVSINYRLNIMGFPNAPGLPDQNLGLIDQRLAIEWVRDNIENFGGDPKRIIIFGESAGAGAVDMYAYAWTKDPIISGIICQSGAAGAMPPAASGKIPHSAWYDMSRAMGCGGPEVGDRTVDCMRGKSFNDINKQLDTMVSGPGITPFAPHPDGKVVFQDTAQRGDSGNFIKVPLVIGNTDHESGLNVAISAAAGGKNPFAGRGKGKDGMAAILNGDKPGLPAGLAVFLPKDFNPMNLMDSIMGCSSASASVIRMKNGVPAWRFRYMGVWKNTDLGPGTGAYHSSDVPIVFGTTELRTGNVKDSSEEAKVVKQTMTAWATFAKDPVNGLEKLGWPKYDESKNTLIRIGYQNRSTLSLGPAKEYDSACTLMSAMSGIVSKQIK